MRCGNKIDLRREQIMGCAANVRSWRVVVALTMISL
jgi:hypothetical protein